MTNLQRLIENLDVNYNDYQLKIQKPCIDFINEDEENAQTKKTLIRDAIKPQVTIAQNVIQAISTAYNDKCDQTKKIGDMEDHIKSWENQVHGACEQIIKTVEAKDGSVDRPESIVNDSSKCSPRAFNKYIKNYTSRDYSTLNLCAAIIVFYNSLA